MISTSLLYAIVEQYPLTTNPTSASRICQLKNETIRAMNMSTSDFCKEKLQAFACDIELSENFFPKSLPRYCPIKSRYKTKYIRINFNLFTKKNRSIR